VPQLLVLVQDPPIYKVFLLPKVKAEYVNSRIVELTLLRELDPEAASSSRPGDNTYSAAHQLHSFTHGAQPKADAWKLVLPIKADKRHEYSLLIFA
jgi:hypothetical protein